MRDKNHVYICIRCPLSIYVSLQKYNIMEHTCIHWVEMLITSLHRCFVYGWSIWVEQTLENTEGTNRQSREIGNTRRRNTKQKHNALCVGHHYAKTNTNNVNKTWTVIQTTAVTMSDHITWPFCVTFCFITFKLLIYSLVLWYRTKFD